MQLLTERLLLREFEQADWPAVWRYQTDPRYLRFNPWEARTPENVQEFVGIFVAHQRAQPRLKFQLAVVLRATGQLIGNCGVRLEAAGSHEADLGYELDPEHWGLGYATEAARAMVAFGFEDLRLHRIWAWCVADNAASARVLEKVGMRQEGRLRDKDFFKGRWWDTRVFAILEEEWRGSGSPFVRALGGIGPEG